MLQVTDTITGRTGNLVNFPDIDSDHSISNFKGRSVPGGVTVSLNYKARSIGGSKSVIQFFAATGWFRKGFPAKDYSGKDVKFGETVDFNYPPQEFLAYVDGGDINFPDGYVIVVVSSHDQNYNYGVMRYTWKASKKKFVSEIDSQPWISPSPLGPIGTVKNETFQKGESVLRYGEASYNFPVRNIPNDGEWVTISANAYIDNNLDYDFLNRGVSARLIWQTDGALMIDDVKFGYASEAEVFRGDQSVYRGHLSDFEDITATDKAAPNEPGNVTINIGSDRKPVITWDPVVDNGTTYSYKIRGLSKNAPPTAFSAPVPITVTTGVKGYAVVVDQNPSTVPTAVNVTGTSLTVEPQNGNFFAHIAAVDHQGNMSNVVHVPYVDHVPPQLNVIADHTHWSQGPVILRATAADYETGLKHIVLPDGSLVTGETAQYVAQANGTYTFQAVDNAGNITERTLQVTNIDREAPTIVITPMERTWDTSDIPVEIQYADEQSGVEPNSRMYAVTNSAAAPSQWKVATAGLQHLTLAEEGQWYVHAKVADRAGNTQQLTTQALQLQSLPQAPGDFRITSVESNTVHLAWDLPSGSVATSGYKYEVENVTTGRSWTVTYPEHALTDLDVEPGQAYTYRVRTNNHVGSSAASTVTALTLPAKVDGLSVHSIDREAAAALVYFDPARSAETYHIAVKENSTQQLVLEQTVTAATYHRIEQLQAGMNYTVSVTAENASGRGSAATVGFLSLPGTPGEFKLIQIKTNEARLQWETVTSATYYLLQRDQENVYGGGGTEYGDRGLSAGTEYSYEVSAKNETGFGQTSDPVNVLTLPEVVKTVTAATYGTDQITLRWTVVKGAAFYTIGVDGSDVATVTAATYGKPMEYTIEGLHPGTDYRFHLYAENRSGAGETSLLSAQTLPAAMPDSDITIDEIGETQAALHWKSAPGATKYRVTLDGQVYERSGTELQLNGLAGGHQYTVSLEAGNESGYGPATSALFLTLPPQVNGLQAKEKERELQLMWEPAPSAEWYQLEQNGQPLGKTTATSWNVSDLVAGESYRFTVRAVNATGEGSPTPFVWRALPNEMSGLQVNVTNVTEHGAALSWDAVAGADRYRVYEGDKQLAEAVMPAVMLEGLESARPYAGLKVVPVNTTGESAGAIVPAFDTLPSGEFAVGVQAGQHELQYQFELASPHEVFVLVKDGKEVYRGSERSFTLSSLQSRTDVKVEVWTENAAGQRSKGQVIRARTLDDPSSGGGSVIVYPDRNPEPVPNPKPELEQPGVIPGETAERPEDGDKDLASRDIVDINGLWNREQILTLLQKGILHLNDGKFEPKRAVTRAEFMAMIVRAVGLEEKDADLLRFRDVRKDAWYYQPLRIAYSNGVIHGYSAFVFRPDERITREEAAKMLGNVVEHKGGELRLRFRDKARIANWAKREIEILTAHNIVHGYPDDTFRPKQLLNRAESASFVYKIIF
ncbi:fibronectin type III domain-containing protein [Paenibacillus melissococcoides]|uniref:fibronectin type III domain-containing protein n=1 Tax=Paenibacillus melissococcoides TaxID=2912268 RepID=UPI0038B2A04D